MSFEEQQAAAQALSVFLTLSFFGYLFWAFPRRRRRKDDPVADGPLNEPYKIYTDAFDVEVPGRDVAAVIAKDGLDRARGWTVLDPEHRARLIAGAKTRRDRMRPHPSQFDAALPVDLDSVAICLLVDLSGSLKGDRVEAVAASCAILADALSARGAAVAILGFSTLGWRGGRARDHWLADGAPKRPGRLCVLFHVIIKAFDAPLDERDWEAMLDQDLLRENVDGEALIWAEQLLLARDESRRVLLVLSDGAPVDDTTLMHNGLSYLTRHLEATIARIAADEMILLGGVGVGVDFDVGYYYPISDWTRTLDDLPIVGARLIARLLAPKVAQ